MYEAKAVLKKTFKAKARLSSITVNTSGCVDVVVHNSDNSYTESISQAETPFELPDLTHRDSDNQDVVLPAMTPFIATPCKLLSAYSCNELNSGLNQTQKDCVYDAFPIAYNRPMPTGQTTIYANYDDAWHQVNGTHNYSQRGVRPRLSSFNTLHADTPNIHGNTNRFTDINGLQVYALQIFSDHFTGLIWHYPSNNNVVAEWNQAMFDAAQAYTVSGLDNWRVCNFDELDTLCNMGMNTTLIGYAPFSFTSGNEQFWTSTTLGFDPGTAYFLDNNSNRITYRAKTNSSQMKKLYVRNF